MKTLLLLLTLLPAGCAETTPQASIPAFGTEGPGPTGWHTVEGEVRRGESPLGQARVRLRSGDSILATAETGPDGAFELRCRAPFTDVRIEVRADGSPWLERPLGTLPAGGVSRPDPLPLIPGLPLVGRAESSLGRALGSVDLRIEQRRGGDLHYVEGIITDADARFQFLHAPVGPSEILARARDHADARVRTAGTAGEEVSVVLEFQPRLRVVVRDEDRRPIPGAFGRIWTRPGAPEGRGEYSNRGGLLDLRYLESPDWRLEISAAGYRGRTLEGVTPEIESRTVILEALEDGESR